MSRSILIACLGFHKTSIAYLSSSHRRFNQPFNPTSYGPPYSQGDVIGVGYRPRTGTIFFTRNGKKLDDVVHGLKTQNFFPTVGANGPCHVHVNFGQMGFVFIEANVKKWGLAPMTGSLAPPPPYGSEAGSILLEGGRDGVREGAGYSGYMTAGHHVRNSSAQIRISRQQHPTSPGPQRSPTDISLAQLSLVDSNEDVGEGTSTGMGLAIDSELPPEYESPETTPLLENVPHFGEDERRPLLGPSRHRTNERDPPIPSYSDAVADAERGRSRSNTVIRRT